MITTDYPTDGEALELYAQRPCGACIDDEADLDLDVAVDPTAIALIDDTPEHDLASYRDAQADHRDVYVRARVVGITGRGSDAQRR